MSFFDDEEEIELTQEDMKHSLDVSSKYYIENLLYGYDTDSCSISSINLQNNNIVGVLKPKRFNINTANNLPSLLLPIPIVKSGFVNIFALDEKANILADQAVTDMDLAEMVYNVIIYGMPECESTLVYDNLLDEKLLNVLKHIELKDVPINNVYLFGKFDNIDFIKLYEEQLHETFNIEYKNIKLFAENTVKYDDIHTYTISALLNKKVILYDDLKCSLSFKFFPEIHIANLAKTLKAQNETK